MAAMIEFPRPDGRTVGGWLAEPAADAARDGAPGVVVIQEWWGLNAQIRGVAERLAAAGLRALVPDLYRGRSTVEAEEASHLMNGLDFADAASQDIAGAIAHLRAGGSAKVGVTGFCMGGALTLLALGASPDAACGVVWYGLPPIEFVEPARLRMPILAHWATQDRAFPIASVDALEARLRAGGVDGYRGHRYLAHHAFANETAQGPGRIELSQYDAAWAQLAWDRTFAFLGRHLG